MKPKYIIKDWAGNEMNWGTFTSFEDAWDCIYTRLTHLSDEEFEIECQEYWACEL